MSATFDNLSDADLFAMREMDLAGRVGLYALIAADKARRDPVGYADVSVALDRAVRVWRQRGLPCPERV